MKSADARLATYNNYIYFYPRLSKTKQKISKIIRLKKRNVVISTLFFECDKFMVRYSYFFFFNFSKRFLFTSTITYISKDDVNDGA